MARRCYHGDPFDCCRVCGPNSEAREALWSLQSAEAKATRAAARIATLEIALRNMLTVEACPCRIQCDRCKRDIAAARAALAPASDGKGGT